jgi:hypothetical protein
VLLIRDVLSRIRIRNTGPPLLFYIIFLNVIRVLEVVEKMESVAWKLEYDLPFFPEASPSTKRKLSPQVCTK